MSRSARIDRGEVWLVDLDPTRGHEQAKKRLCLVVSVDLFNHSSADLIAIVPITSKKRKIRWFVHVKSPEGGIEIDSCIMSEQLRFISISRFDKRIGRVSKRTLLSVMERIRILLDL